MKSLAELEAIRKQTLDHISLRKEDKNAVVQVIVGMATCGIAAGARPVLLSFMEEVNKRSLTNVIITPAACAGTCELEPVVDVILPGQEKVTYVNMTAEKAVRVVAEHIVEGRPVTEYTAKQ